jgi:hypothetical protein
MTEEYFPITKQELSLIKNNCFHPETDSCDGCEYVSDGDLPCTWEGANRLEEKILFRITMKDEIDIAIDDLRKIVADLYDDGFKDPMVTFDAAVNKFRYGDLKLRKEQIWITH